ncbi:hypothetical protein [Serratia grimesii]|uniref:hypothetical protein n=1 Tax=Serratia grimesii TaxID=82995 RepID=UPI000938B1DA|nr:hypothetical protein [Serratia grimesii]
MNIKISGKKISAYQKILVEKSRPPSRGGNGKALHSHIITIDGIRYSFLANDSKQWVFKSDTVSFEYESEGVYNNINRESITTVDKNGDSIIRGNRGYTKKMRTADTRLPGSRRECRD